jgi:methionine transaminase
MIPLESRLPRVGTTIFTVMSQLAQDLGAVNLGQGFPDFDPDPEFEAALVRHMRAGRNQYAPMAGVPRLREQIALKLERDYGCKVHPGDELTVTTGATEGIFSTIAALVHPGDEVIVLDPCYDCYEPAVELQGGRTVHVPLRADFGLDFERIRAAITERTRLIVLNFPHNPSGALLTPGDLETLAALVRNTRVFLLADEVYEHITFDGRAHQSLLRSPELRARSLVVSSFGKSHHATGWKIGWVAAPAALTAEVRRVHQFVTFSVCHPAQYAFADLLEHRANSLAELGPFYQRKRDLFRSLIADSPLKLLPTAATYFQLADYSAISTLEDTAFARYLCQEMGVAAIPVSVFCQTPPARRLVRFCFCKHDETLQQGAARLMKLTPLAR